MLADWVHLLAARFSHEAEQSRQRTPHAVRSPLSLAAAPADVMKSGALRVVAGLARVCPLAPDITPSLLGCSAWFVTCLLCVCLPHAGVLVRLAYLDTDFLVTVALLPLIFSSFQLCVCIGG